MDYIERLRGILANKCSLYKYQINVNMDMKKIVYYLLHERRLLKIVILAKLTKFFSDKYYIEKMFELKFGYKPDLDSPQTFNEKLNWLKLNNRNPLYTMLADKYSVKEYVAQTIGEKYVVPCYGKWECFEDIDFDTLPNQFVLKLNHDSSGAFICNNKNTIDKKELKKVLSRNIKRNYYWWLREWPYKNIKPCILSEKLLVDGTGAVLRDYKFWCFNGEPKYMYCTVKGVKTYENFYDMNFSPVDINHGFPRHIPEFDKPANFELMKDLAAKLSKGIPFVRVDFFDVEGHVYFGEYTFYDWGGMRPFVSINVDKELGSYINIKG